MCTVNLKPFLFFIGCCVFPFLSSLSLCFAVKGSGKEDKKEEEEDKNMGKEGKANEEIP